LFGGFWRRGEMVLLFGTAGVGKSLLAVQLADALARGRPIGGLDMPRRRAKVLYVDLILSDQQFQARYSRDTGREGPVTRFVFSQNLYRDRPAETDDLARWAASQCAKHDLAILIVDDLSAVTRSDDGTRETLRLVRELKRLTLEQGLSIMVLADSVHAPHTRDAGEADLRRSRVLCSVADSVIMMDEVRGGGRRLSQTRSQMGEGGETTARLELAEFDSGMIGFDFEEEWDTLDEETLGRVRRAHELHEAGNGVRAIGAALGLSKSTAARLLKRWTPDMEDDASDGRRDRDDEPFDNDREANERYGFDIAAAGKDTHASEDGPDDVGLDDVEIPPLLTRGLSHLDADSIDIVGKSRSILDMPRSQDRRGCEIYVESEDESTLRPIVWYTRDSDGTFSRHERKTFGVEIKRLDRSEWV
jgi:KaiC/GvpD/RAD55 family RecA-like ATPase